MSDAGGLAVSVAPVPYIVPGRPGTRLPRSAIVPGWMIEAAGFMALFAITRSFLFGNPVVHIDEQFYLLVAQRMQDGALPYVDIWDRKPFGLFLLYRALIALPVDPVLAYQLGAGAAFVCTAMVIARIARQIAPVAAAWQAGAAYILFMPVFNAGMGQAPVFYNLLVAMAAWGVIDCINHQNDRSLLWRGSAIMLLLGLAIQIKYTVIFEGAALGLVLLFIGFSQGQPIRRLMETGALWIAVALLPTVAAFAWFAVLGQADTFSYANFGSIFARTSGGGQAWWRLAKEVAVLMPFWLAIFHAPSKFATTAPGTVAPLRVIRIWAVAACGGFLFFGTWYDHYVAPLLVPLAILAAPALARPRVEERWYGRLLLGFGAFAGMIVMVYQFNQHGSSRQFAAMDAAIRQEMHGGCLYIYEGELAFYRTTNSCLPTRWTFPNHLNTFIEAPAIGVDASVEELRILATRPDVIVMRDSKLKPYMPNADTRRIITDELARSYTRYARVQLGNKEYWLYRPRR